MCDAIDPGMTFVVPLASGIVERRGGMLIHGAIIAREYGIPCVTGVAEAASLIQTGDTVTVDGFLGIVIPAKAGVQKSLVFPDSDQRTTLVCFRRNDRKKSFPTFYETLNAK